LGNGWEFFQPEEVSNGDMILGNDVWIGYDSLILPEAKIDDGAAIDGDLEGKILTTRSQIAVDIPRIPKLNW
jgi:hypothetical protein